ncbi:MAG: hypothetical protein Kow00107_01650 [Planctomycetota bacterium]
MPAIRIKNGPQKGHVFEIQDVGILIGNAPEADIRLYDNKVEALHCRIYRVGEMYFIRNLAEEGYTYLNDERITEELLREGDVIRVGSTNLVFDSSRATIRAVEESDYLLEDFVFDVSDPDVMNPTMDIPEGGSRHQADLETIREFLEIGVEQKAPRKYLSAATEFIRDRFRCDLAAVVLSDKSGKNFKVAGVSKDAKAKAVIADSIVNYALTRRKPLLIADAMGDKRFSYSPSVTENEVHSVICIPMIARDTVTGCLYLAFDEMNGVFSPDDFHVATILGLEIGLVLENLNTFSKHTETIVSVVRALSTAVDLHDPIMMGHSERVGRYSQAIAEFLNFPQEEVNDFYLAGLLHDIGRIGQNDDIVETQRGIYRGELGPITEHVELGVKILSGIVDLEHLIPAVETHHEFWDGSGLPKGLKGEEIPIGGRILCAANVLDEYLHPIVPERKPMSVAEAMKNLKLEAGKKLDEKIVNAFLVAYRKGAIQI